MPENFAMEVVFVNLCFIIHLYLIPLTASCYWFYLNIRFFTNQLAPDVHHFEYYSVVCIFSLLLEVNYSFVYPEGYKDASVCIYNKYLLPLVMMHKLLSIYLGFF